MNWILSLVAKEACISLVASFLRRNRFILQLNMMHNKINYFCARAILLNRRRLVNTAVTMMTLAAANARDSVLIPPP